MGPQLKSYRSAQSIVADIERTLADNRPSFHHSPLEYVVKLLIEGRHYSWVGIYLSANRKSSPELRETAHPAHVAVPETRKKIVVSIRIAGRELGSLGVESDREHSFGSVDRVLLEQVAGLLARFLTSKGKYLVRRALESAAAATPKAAAA
jgi:putative methionine-R-sulfoxide reductase with GAF domain